MRNRSWMTAGALLRAVLACLVILVVGRAVWAAAAGGEHGGGEHGGGGSEQHAHGSWIQFLYHYKILPADFPDFAAMGILTAIVLGIGAFLMTRNLQRIPSRGQAALEIIVSGLENFTRDMIGPTGPRYLPLIGTLFIYILIMNLSGLVPGWKAPTANLNVTIPLALCVFIYVQYLGIKSNGLGGYLKHFAGEPAWLAPLNFPIHFIGELARPVSLSIRLFGNIFGEESVVANLLALGMIGSLFIPIQTPMFFFGVFTSIVQALVFSILTCAYIAGATVHEDHGDHAHDDHGGHPGADLPHGAHDHAAPHAA